MRYSQPPQIVEDCLLRVDSDEQAVSVFRAQKNIIDPQLHELGSMAPVIDVKQYWDCIALLVGEISPAWKNLIEDKSHHEHIDTIRVLKEGTEKCILYHIDEISFNSDENTIHFSALKFQLKS